MSVNRSQIVDLNVRVAKRLMSIYGECKRECLVFPPLGRCASRKRISEQEARVIFTDEIRKMGRRFSVETPTRKKYHFTGKGYICGRIDVSIYKGLHRKSRTPALHIELKSGNPEQLSISKDLAKLMFEGVPGCFFHVIEQCDRGTVKALIRKYRKGIDRETAKKYVQGGGKANLRRTPDILFCIAILSKKKCLLFQWTDQEEIIDPDFDPKKGTIDCGSNWRMESL